MELDINVSRDKVITVRVSDDELDKIYYLSYMMREKRASVVRKALLEYYDNYMKEESDG